MEEPEEGKCDEALMCMYMDMYEDPEEVEELWTILLDENLMMSMPLDRMKMEEQSESVNTESILDVNPNCDVASDNPTPATSGWKSRDRTR